MMEARLWHRCPDCGIWWLPLKEPRFTPLLRTTKPPEEKRGDEKTCYRCERRNQR